jgi:MFS family permease
MLIQARSSVGLVALHAFLTLSCQWFDSMALVVLGPQLTGALLPPGTPPLQQLQRLFSIFALGHVLWLLGCMLWPAKAGKLGQKGVLAWTLGLSGFCTALVGCMPSYAEVRLGARDAAKKYVLMCLGSAAVWCACGHMVCTSLDAVIAGHVLCLIHAAVYAVHS